jgi:hypothetical protein
MNVGMNFINGLLFFSGGIVAAVMFRAVLHVGFCG